jgi:hypothetical protein
LIRFIQNPQQHPNTDRKPWLTSRTHPPSRGGPNDIETSDVGAAPLVYSVGPLPACVARSGSFLSAERGYSPLTGGLWEPVTFSAAILAWDRANISREISEWILALLSMLM